MESHVSFGETLVPLILDIFTEMHKEPTSQAN